ncbi:hypothetical protein LOY97_004613 [Ophidiomyces ophidiicola]|nr:hypothetical protein LOZ49_002106 [Ophidiomyces ophidiicola]KAI2135546.1 hypothetical protein LOZ29_003866 [Ophidiomyces ophidiicola]KAI2137772.1 hypothetical protein LOZ28_003775 [Ophidiomyces ophidiicola]KAI2348547.1 hypothetical protein LOY92_004193 [Ophidiomyces ophidiicola]KAI2437124.1 hypothetical protein LOZ08_005422 [Ophidiomyces ophidiicola]
MPSSNSTTSSGITTNATTGERHVPASVRADGSVRREIRIRPGYRPPEDVELYKNRAAESWKHREKGGIPGAEGLNDNESKLPTPASTKNAKKREAKKRAKAANDSSDKAADKETLSGDVMNQAPSRPGKQGEQEAEVPPDPELEKEKKARNLKKKLKQARELRDKKDKGESLLPEQFEKVIKINELIRQLNALGFDSEGDKLTTNLPTDSIEINGR